MAQFPDCVYEDRELYDVLAKATDEELGVLVGLMLRKLSCSLHGACRDVPAIVNEFQRFGGHTLVNPLRGRGVRYAEIVKDVAAKVGVDLSGCQSVSEKERRIVDHLLEAALERMDEEDRRKFYEELKKQSGVQNFQSVKDLLLTQGAYQAVRLISVQVIVRQLLVKLGIRQAAALAGGRLLAILGGPVGWGVGGIWAAIDIAGPAYSVTVPGVMLVAMIRARLTAEQVARCIGGR